MGPPRPFSLLVALLLALAGLVSPARAAPTFPPLTGRVVDAANILPPDVEARLDQKLAALETQSHRQLVVATLPDLQGYEISDYGYQLGRAWGIGDKQRNDGALLIVAPNQRKVRIEVGYGLEGVLTDGLSSLIISQTIVPKFKQGDMPGGIEAGVDALVHQLTLPPEEAQRIAQQATSQPQGGFDPGLIVFALIFLFFFVLPLFRSLRGGRRYGRSGLPGVMIWPGGGGGGGWSGGSDSGFSGGGGSFGGGGSSGSW